MFSLLPGFLILFQHKHCGCIQYPSLGPGMFVDVYFLHQFPLHLSGSSSFNDLTESDSYLDTFSCWSPDHFPTTYERERPVQVLSVEAYIVPPFSLTSRSPSAQQAFRYKLAYVLEMGMDEWSIRVGKCWKTVLNAIP